MTPKKWLNGSSYLGLGALAGWTLFHIDTIRAMTENLFYTCVFGAGAFLIIMDFLGARRIWTFYQFLLSKLLSLLIEMDPVRIARLQLTDMRKRADEIRDKGMADLRGKANQVGTKMKKNEGRAEEVRARILKLRDQTEIALAQKEVKIISEQQVKYQTLIQRANFLYDCLDKVYKALDALVRGKTMELDYYESDYELTKGVHATFKKAIGIIRGVSSGDSVYNQSIDYINQFVDQKNGEIDSFMLTIGDFMKKMDLADLDEGLFKQIEAQSNQLLLSVTTEAAKPLPSMSKK